MASPRIPPSFLDKVVIVAIVNGSGSGGALFRAKSSAAKDMSLRTIVKMNNRSDFFGRNASAV